MQSDPANQETLDAKEALDIIFEISELLNCDLDKGTLSILVSLCENGVNPVALATIVKELKNEAQQV